MKIINLVAVFFLLLTLSSCHEIVEPPSGVWISSDPNIILYMKPQYALMGEYSLWFPGIYTVNGEDIKVVVTMTGRSPHFMIRDLYVRGQSWEDVIIFYDGSFRESNGELIYTIPHGQGNGGNKVITFNRVWHYAPINPEDWILPPPPFELPPEFAGAWESVDPHMVIYLDPEHTGAYRGIFGGKRVTNAGELDARVLFSSDRSMRANIITISLYGDLLELLSGEFRRAGGQLHFYMSPFHQERFGMYTIIFNRVESYGITEGQGLYEDMHEDDAEVLE